MRSLRVSATGLVIFFVGSFILGTDINMVAVGALAWTTGTFLAWIGSRND